MQRMLTPMTTPRTEVPLAAICADACRAFDERTVEIYALTPQPTRPATPSEVNRVGGMPLGVPDEAWPRDEDGTRFAHVCTLDLATMPSLLSAPPCRGYRAASLFVRNPLRIDAHHGRDFRLRWLFLRDEELARGIVPARGPSWGDEAHEARPFSVEALHVPLSLFSNRTARDERLVRLRHRIKHLPGRAGGGALMLQSDDSFHSDDHPFFLQLDESFELNLGDGGLAYISEDTMVFDCC